MTAEAASAPPDRRTRLVLAVLVLGGLMVVLDITITNVAIRSLSEDLDAPLPVIQWVTTGYTLALAVAVPTTAWLVGRLGTTRVYLLAVGLFVLGSALGGLAWNVGSLIAFRVVQGLGGGLVNPVAMTIALRAAPPERRGRTMGLLGLPVLVGPLAGPTLGGWLVGYSWRWIFLINVPVGLLALALAWRVFPRERPVGGGRLDVPGLAMLGPGLALVLYGLAESGRLGTVASTRVVLPALVGVALCVLFVLRALRVTQPLVQIRLLRQRAMAAGVSVLTLFAAAYFGSLFLLPLYWQVVRGLSPAETGLMAIPQALTTGITLQIASRLVDRVAPARVVGFGITVATAGLLTNALLLHADTPYWQILAVMAVTGIGTGATIMPTITTALRYLADSDAPSGSTLLNIVNQVGVSLGTALISVVFTSGLAGLAIAGAHGALPDHVTADQAVGVARVFRHTLLVSVALMAVSGVVALIALPRRRAAAPAAPPALAPRPERAVPPQTAGPPETALPLEAALPLDGPEPPPVRTPVPVDGREPAPVPAQLPEAGDSPA